MSAQKSPEGSETETRELLGGMEENSFSPTRGHWFFTKRKQNKIELVARPAASGTLGDLRCGCRPVCEERSGGSCWQIATSWTDPQGFPLMPGVCRFLSSAGVGHIASEPSRGAMLLLGIAGVQCCFWGWPRRLWIGPRPLVLSRRCYPFSYSATDTLVRTDSVKCSGVWTFWNSKMNKRVVN